jgi:hypothetical protein
MTGKNRLRVRSLARAAHYEFGFGSCKVWTESVKSGTSLSKAKLPANKIILFVYFWLGDSKLCKISQWVDIHPTTASDWNGFLNELATLTITTKFDGSAGKIGWLGVIVEIDVSKFGKRKYNRSHHVEGTWVFRGVERLYDDQGNAYLDYFLLSLSPIVKQKHRSHCCRSMSRMAPLSSVIVGRDTAKSRTWGMGTAIRPLIIQRLTRHATERIPTQSKAVEMQSSRAKLEISFTPMKRSCRVIFGSRFGRAR